MGRGCVLLIVAVALQLFGRGWRNERDVVFGFCPGDFGNEIYDVRIGE
jgi:hypothetical protein